VKKNTKKKVENKAVAFLNWSVVKKDGSLFKSGRGFPIFNNPEYPNPQEAKLVELAESRGGMVELDMKVRIMINKPAEDVPLDDFIVD